MVISDLSYISALEARRLFTSRDLSPVELMEAMIERSRVADSTVNALVARYFDEALDAAADAERRFREPDSHARPLEGLPVAIKDETPIAGRITTSGSLLFADAVSSESAPVVERLVAAGAIIHARTATPEFCCAPFTHSRLWGTTRNPWDPACDPGGSSGGAAAALAAGMTTLADGSDIGGSIRVPAAFCGVVGYKPPYGRVPSTMPFALDTFNHQGPLARSVADCALMQNVMSGWHPADPATVRERVHLPVGADADPRGRRIALSLDLGRYRVDESVVRNTLIVADALRAAGATVDEVALDWRPDEVRRATFAHFGAVFAADTLELIGDRSDLLTDYARRFLELAAPSAHGAYFDALQVEVRLYRDLARIFSDYDALICPTNGVMALAAGEPYLEHAPSVNGVPLASVYDAPLTTPFNLTSRCPVLSVPSGLSSRGIPTGVQVVGAPFDDLTVFEVGSIIERELALELRAPTAVFDALA